MGILRELVLLPLAPVRGVLWTVGQVLDVAELEHVEAIKRDLAELDRAFEEQEITEEELDEREDRLLDQLELIESRLPGGPGA